MRQRIIKNRDRCGSMAFTNTCEKAHGFSRGRNRGIIAVSGYALSPRIGKATPCFKGTTCCRLARPWKDLRLDLGRVRGHSVRSDQDVDRQTRESHRLQPWEDVKDEDSCYVGFAA